MQKNTFWNLILKSLLIFWMMIFCGACANGLLTGKTEKVMVRLPSWDSDLLCAEILNWKISVRGDSERNGDFMLAGTETGFVLEVEKNEPVSVLAQPIVLTKNNLESAFFFPAGGIYPYAWETAAALEEEALAGSAERTSGVVSVNAVNGVLVLDWYGGAAAFLMERLYTAGEQSGYKEEMAREFLAGFNWKKLLETMYSKAEQSTLNMRTEVEESGKVSKAVFYNPWLLDFKRVVEGIGYNNFKADLLNLKGVFSVEAEVIESDWCSFERDNSEKEAGQAGDSSSAGYGCVISAFVPENQIKKEFNRLSLKKNCENFFSLSNTYGIIVKGNSAKNLSLEYVSMPININDL